jgi:hypothetical protein
VNFEQLMDRLYPWFEQSGSPEAVERSFMEHAGQCVLTLSEEGIALSPINAVKLIFDTTPTVDLEIPELLTTGFPIPLPEYGISYI